MQWFLRARSKLAGFGSRPCRMASFRCGWVCVVGAGGAFGWLLALCRVRGADCRGGILWRWYFVDTAVASS